MPERPWFPKRLPFLAVGFVMASAIGTGLGLLRDRGDRTLRMNPNLPQVAGVSVVGYILWVHQRREARWLVHHLFNPTLLREAIRALYSHCFLVSGEAPRTLMVGFSDMNEGKAFLTLAMALVAVSTGRRVLVIEADRRRSGAKSRWTKSSPSITAWTSSRPAPP